MTSNNDNVTFAVVSERPTFKERRGSEVSALGAALLGTATTGEAVRIELNGRKKASVLTGLYSLTARHYGKQYQLRVASDGEAAITVWLEARQAKADLDAQTKVAT